jgi:hypothetical protein
MQLASLCTTFHAQSRVLAEGACRAADVKPCSTREGWLEWAVSLDGPSHPAHPAAALDAFEHGVAVRSWVLARHQAGDADRADRLLEAALARFRTEAVALPLAQWPLAWWGALLEDRGMLVPAAPAAADPLRRLPPGPRAALLLRLVAGLDLPHAAQALGVSQAAHDAALDQALRAPGLDAEAIEALRVRLHDEVQVLAQAQRERHAAAAAHAADTGSVVPALAQVPAIAAVPERPVFPAAVTPEEAPAAAPSPNLPPLTRAADAPPPSWRERGARQRTGLGVGLAILVGALLLGLWWRRPPAMPPGTHEALPAERVAPLPPLDAAHVVTHPDYALVAHPEDERLARDLAFFSWLAASTEPPARATPAAPTPPPDAIPLTWRNLLAPADRAWTSLDPTARAQLLAQAADWEARDAASRAALVRALQAWDRLPATERARRRDPMASWQDLGAGERAQVAAAARHFAARTVAEQTDLRLQFAALPDDAQHAWRLGPALGPELTGLAPLFAFLPEADRPALLAALRTLDLDARRNLALLAPRLSEAGRDQLRRELVSAPPAQRAALIAARIQ